jgi:hypothetical protein
MYAIGKQVLFSVRNLLSYKLMYGATICPMKRLSQSEKRTEKKKKNVQVIQISPPQGAIVFPLLIKVRFSGILL